jgi:hypothetical protein
VGYIFCLSLKSRESKIKEEQPQTPKTLFFCKNDGGESKKTNQNQGEKTYRYQKNPWSWLGFLREKRDCE